MFGPHLTLDVYGCNKEKLNDYDFMYNILHELPELLGLNKFSAPQLTQVPPRPNSFDQGGITGFVILVESHMSVHTFPADGFASIDIFSCKSFDLELAMSYLMTKLEAAKCEHHFIERGKDFVKHYPKSVDKAAKIASRERKLVVKS